MRLIDVKSSRRLAACFAAAALFGTGTISAQVSLTAAPTTTTLPDGTSVPMWGYTCGAPGSGTTATCRAANPAATGWSPVVITVPTGADAADQPHQ